jgi:lysophospholipid acyltransferase (LPLAT)-like uncharacterized protein
MKLRHPLLIKSAGLAAAWLIRGWMNTLSVRLGSRTGVTELPDPRKERCIFLFWHETLLFPTLFRTRVHVLISQHADGELIAQVCRHLRIGVVRGSTTRGGAAGLWDLLKMAEHSHLAITPDGPRGPRRRVQLGAIFLAAHTGLPIVPIGVGYANAWRARTWDRFALPRPYSLATGIRAESVHVPADFDPAALSRQRQIVEQSLTDVTDEAERWAQGRARRSSAAHPGLTLAA